MKNEFSISTCLWFFMLLALCWIANANRAIGQNLYYANCYNYGYDITIQMKVIDLDQKTIIKTVDTPIKGWVPLSIPILVEQNQKRFYIVVANDGGPAKNSDFMQNPILNYAVIDSNLHLITQGHLDSLTLVDELHYPQINLSLNIFEEQGEGEMNKTFKGQPFLNSRDSLQFINRKYYSPGNETSPEIGGYRYFMHIDLSNDRYFWLADCSGGIDLFVIDYPNKTLVNMRQIASNRSHGNLFALSPDDSIIYAFFTNYNGVGGSIESLNKLERDSSYLNTYHSETLTQIDSIELPYPILDSGYVVPETGICDRVGPYLVYYFFADEGIEEYDPAMLFIFDTRTNQATWLRVGWR